MQSQPPPFQLKETPDPERKRPIKAFLVVCISLAIASLLYRLLVIAKFEQSALMFVGLPTVLAISLGFLPSTKSATGMIMKGVTLFLLLLGILFIEGLVCILMAAPFFYGIGLIVGLLADLVREKMRNDRRIRIVLIPAIALMSLEGVTGILSFPRDEIVSATYSTQLSLSEARAALARGPEFDPTVLPNFLKIGFPQPQAIHGGGLDLGDTWEIHFAGGEGEPGDLLAKVVRSEPNQILVNRIEDTSHIAHWLDWQSAEWELIPTANGTDVTLTVHYRRLLDPAWYFKPLQRYGVKTAAEYFLTSIFENK